MLSLRQEVTQTDLRTTDRRNDDATTTYILSEPPQHDRPDMEQIDTHTDTHKHTHLQSNLLHEGCRITSGVVPAKIDNIICLLIEKNHRYTLCTAEKNNPEVWKQVY